MKIFNAAVFHALSRFRLREKETGEFSRIRSRGRSFRVTTFEDGTRISYDRKKSLLTVNAVGDIRVIAGGDIDVDGAMIYLN